MRSNLSDADLELLVAVFVQCADLVDLAFVPLDPALTPVQWQAYCEDKLVMTFDLPLRSDKLQMAINNSSDLQHFPETLKIAMRARLLSCYARKCLVGKLFSHSGLRAS